MTVMVTTDPAPMPLVEDVPAADDAKAPRRPSLSPSRAADFKLASNRFEMEWPPRSGKRQEFPEVDEARFFPLELARSKINQAQVVFLDRLLEALENRAANER